VPRVPRWHSLALDGTFVRRDHGARGPRAAREKQWFDAIDGKRTIADIAGARSLEPARAWFEQVWWHDQVVFASDA